MGCGTNFAKSFYCLIAEYPSTNLHKNSVYCIRDTIPVVGTAIMSGDVRQLFGPSCPACVPIAPWQKKTGLPTSHSCREFQQAEKYPIHVQRKIIYSRQYVLWNWRVISLFPFIYNRICISQHVLCAVWMTGIFSALGPIYTVRFLSHATSLRQAYDLRLGCTSEKCRSILKHVLKRCSNRKSCRRPAVSLSHGSNYPMIDLSQQLKHSSRFTREHT